MEQSSRKNSTPITQEFLAQLNSLLEHPQFTDLLAQRGLIKKTCGTCAHFKMREAPPRNRVCRYEGKLEWDGAQCLCWMLEPNPENRRECIHG